MTLELRILTGARAGVVQTFEDKVDVTIGRHAMSDLRFDPQGDLDVSTRHAELRQQDGGWTIDDMSSTNGTFVNGQRLDGTRRLIDGDVVSFGMNGPRMEVRGVGGTPSASAPATSLHVTPKSTPVTAPVSTPRKDTNIRVAEAVHAQTKSMRRTFIGTVGVLVAAVAIGLVYWQRQTSAHDAALLGLIAKGESTTVALQKQLAAAGPVDSATRAQIEQQLKANQADVAKVRDMAAGKGTGNVELLSRQISRSKALTSIDVPRIHEANDAAVAMVVADLGETKMAGTAFGVTAGGMMITNRHVVRTAAGAPAVRIAVIYANTNRWLPAHIVRVGEGEGEDNDLALIQVDAPGKYPTVTGVSRTGALAEVGAPLLTIGYPGANETPMEGKGLEITARTTTTNAMVSKRLETVIQLDSYSGHGASGSPVFDAAGNVVGVIYGGAGESGGRIVYAVPAQRLAAFLGKDAPGIIR